MGISNVTTLPVRWLRVPAACRYSGLSRSLLYRLIGEGKIKSVALRDKGKLQGIRLISAESIDHLLESIANAEGNPASQTASAKAETEKAPEQPESNSGEDDSFSEFEWEGNG